ncbi:Alpha/Beta hydrolase protein [Thamnocephalis sphaerospora]|uniref:Alpha/Beta hydrolase protein n=1 Tax=Thamnocephalis sphaerospora TaxID=78915 RepID=A0A4P9XNY2_9FUNG|nr:Alpha/Beta hydrolase protein [Thamnocephalis sphaerospora]|eukprot:RKP07707.1 Alpha/Beta hydrolase protein [Thamnocephalis sphaerospora]
MEFPQLLVDMMCFAGFLVHSALLALEVPILHAVFGPPVRGWSLIQHCTIRLLRAANADLKIHQLRMLTRLNGWWRVLGEPTERDDLLNGYWVGDTPWSARARIARGEIDLVLLYIHGGGFCVGNPFMAFPAVRDWQQRLGQQGIRLAVLAVEYALAPEAHYLDPVHTVTQTARELQRLPGLDASRFVVAGDSAGAHLAVEVTRQLGADEQPQGLLLLSPWVRLYPEPEAICRNMARDFLLPSALRNWADAYLDSVSGGRNAGTKHYSTLGDTPPSAVHAVALTPTLSNTPLLSPTTPTAPAQPTTTLSSARLPRCFIVVGQRELLVEDAVAYACLLEEAGTEVALMVEPSAVHNFSIEPMVAGRASYRRAVANITGYLRAVMTDDRKWLGVKA